MSLWRTSGPILIRVTDDEMVVRWLNPANIETVAVGTHHYGGKTFTRVHFASGRSQDFEMSVEAFMERLAEAVAQKYGEG